MNKKQITHWLKVAVIGIALGFALQFVRAWTEPTTSPPGGNVGAPINTSTVDQTKGTATQGKIMAADFCLNNGTKCLSGGTAPICNNNGTCDAAAGENYLNCPDCPSPPSGPVCGNGACETGETSSCCGDCGTCPPSGPVCGNGVCETGETTACSDCPCECDISDLNCGVTGVVNCGGSFGPFCNLQDCRYSCSTTPSGGSWTRMECGYCTYY